MTRIDFYILPDDELNARHDFCCKLIAKTFKMGHRIVLLCQDDSQAQVMDALLWSFKDISFLPHTNLCAKKGDQTAMIASDNIVIISNESQDNAPEDHHDLLINLAGEIPAWFSRFERVSEIVVQTQQVLEHTRTNYRQYTAKNYPLHRHDMR